MTEGINGQVAVQGISVSKIDSFACKDGWAFAIAEVGANGHIVVSTYVFQAEGPYWIPQNRSKVCGSTPQTSKVPASLYTEACQTN